MAWQLQHWLLFQVTQALFSEHMAALTTSVPGGFDSSSGLCRHCVHVVHRQNMHIQHADKMDLDTLFFCLFLRTSYPDVLASPFWTLLCPFCKINALAKACSLCVFLCVTQELLQQYLGSRSWRVSVSSRPAWSTEQVPGQLGL